MGGVSREGGSVWWRQQEDGPVSSGRRDFLVLRLLELLVLRLRGEHADVQHSLASTVISLLEDSARGRPCTSPFLHFPRQVTME